MENKIKVAHVIRVFSYGGAEVLLRDFFASPVYRAHTVTDLFILDHKKLGFLNIVKPNIRQAYYYKITTFLFLVEYIKFLRQLKKGNYQIVHTHLPVAAWMGIVGKIFCRKTKFVYTEHNLVTFYSKYNYYLGGIVYPFFDSVIFISEEVGEVIKQQQKGKWFYYVKHPVVVLNGIDTEKYFCSNRKIPLSREQKITVGLVARFRPQKRVDKWVFVAEAILKKNKNFDFIMIGDGPDFDMLKELIKEKQLTENIQLPGSMNDTAGAYCKMDIFLFTSDFEGFGLSLVEAMSSGCIPITCNIGGIRQMQIENFGYKYEEYNAPAIADKIIAYEEDRNKMAAESVQARAFAVNNFSLSKQISEVLDLYNYLSNLS